MELFIMVSYFLRLYVVGGMGEESDLSSVEIYTPSTQVDFYLHYSTQVEIYQHSLYPGGDVHSFKSGRYIYIVFLLHWKGRYLSTLYISSYLSILLLHR
jgi:hypothetical protein